MSYLCRTLKNKDMKKKKKDEDMQIRVLVHFETPEEMLMNYKDFVMITQYSRMCEANAYIMFEMGDLLQGELFERFKKQSEEFRAYFATRNLSKHLFRHRIEELSNPF